MIKLTMEEKRRIEVIQGIMDGKLMVNEASRVLGRSERQVYRILARVRKAGVEGVLHQNRGNQYARKIKERLKARILKLVKNRYRDINDTHLSELFLEREGITINRESLRQILRRAGIGPKRRRRSPRYRRQRERKAAMGMMLQIDASHHDWLEGRGDPMVLVGAIDDATGTIWARFERSESTWSYLRLMRQIIIKQGIPMSLYSDRHLIFHSPKEPTIVEQIQNVRPTTQFGRAMEELKIQLIKAYSAPAKGRIERAWGTFQDRLIVELRLAKISTLDEANEFLEGFLVKHNRRFSVSPRNKEKLFRKRLPVRELERILCLKETRVVNKDHTISFEGVTLQIPSSSKWASIAKQRVTVLQLKDGSIDIMYKGMVVARFSPKSVERIVSKIAGANAHILAAA